MRPVVGERRDLTSAEKPRIHQLVGRQMSSVEASFRPRLEELVEVVEMMGN